MPYRTVVLTISDSRSRGEARDLTGPALVEALPLFDGLLTHREVIPDETETIRQSARSWCPRADVILTTGGTGLAPRDVTPEAIEPLIDRPLPGFGEIMRTRAFDATPLSIASRGGAGMSGTTLVVWLPGSNKAVRECTGGLAPARSLAGFPRASPSECPRGPLAFPGRTERRSCCT